jgi:RNA polymerase II subunit A C-terminal domain phosphatase SSU72
VQRYKQNGILNMLERNMQVKLAPERWQEAKKHFDIVITFDQRVYDMVVEGKSNFF